MSMDVEQLSEEESAVFTELVPLDSIRQANKADYKTEERRFQGAIWRTLVRYSDNPRKPIGCFVGIESPLVNLPVGWRKIFSIKFELVNVDEEKNVSSPSISMFAFLVSYLPVLFKFFFFLRCSSFR